MVVPTMLLFMAPATAPAILARLNDRVYRHQITFYVLGSIGAFLVIRSTHRLL